jgi:hypothetical protein
LEQLIHKQLAASGQYNLIGGYWEASNKNEIDVVALNELDKTALIGEVKRNPKSLRLSHLKEKARKLEQKLAGYDITYRGFSLEDLK